MRRAMAPSLLLGWRGAGDCLGEARLAGWVRPRLTGVGALTAEDNNNTIATCECFCDIFRN